MKKLFPLLSMSLFVFGCGDGDGDPTAVVAPAYVVPDSIPWNQNIAYGELIDARDGARYRTVSIGGRTWMAENLRYSAVGSLCPNGDSALCRLFGRLYPWTTAMGIADDYANKVYSTSSTTKQGICPAEWHVPSSAEWKLLQNAVGSFAPGGEDTAALLRSLSGWRDNADGSDVSGFRVVPSGYHIAGTGFTELGTGTHFLTSTEDPSYPYIVSSRAVLGDRDVQNWGFGKSDAGSLRCVRN